MSMPEIRELAGALRRSVAREHERRGGGRYEAEVLAVDPLRLDPLTLDVELDDDDVTLGDLLEAHLEDNPLEVGDTLVLVETTPGDYIAFDLLRGD